MAVTYLPKSSLKWIIILHIPRKERLADSLNIEQLLEIDEQYPNAKVIVAHVGRSYCNRYGDKGLEGLKYSKNIMFDISANTNQFVFDKLIETVGVDRILFGSDLPIFAVHAKRICKGDKTTQKGAP